MITLQQCRDLQNPGERLDPLVLQRFPALGEFAARLGRTPLIEVPSVPGGARIFAKCEWLNPTGTVKDRTAFAMLYHLLRDKTPAQAARLHVLEYTGGTLGIALSKLCQQLGLRRTLVMGSFMAVEVVAAMQREGSDIVLVDKDKGFWAVMQKAIDLARAHPDWSFLYQHTNPANLWVHRELTGGELVQQLQEERFRGLQPVAWVASIGTGGSLAGVYSALAERYPDLQPVGVTPAELPYGSLLPPNGLPKYAGSGGLGSGRRQPFVATIEPHIKTQLTWRFNDTLQAMARFADQTGLRVGSSAAANWLAARTVAQDYTPEHAVLTVFPSLPTPAEWTQAEQWLADREPMVGAAA